MTEYTFDMLDEMTAEELERIVDEDSAKPMEEQMDNDKMLYILSILDRKGGYEDCFTDTEKARKVFLDVYYEDESNAKHSGSGKKQRKNRLSPRFMRIACVIVLVVFLLSVGGVTSVAVGKGFDRPFYNWTDEEFWFSGVDERKEGIYVRGDFDTVPELSQHQMTLIKQNMLEDIMVTYIPFDYYVYSYSVEYSNQEFYMEIHLNRLYEYDIDTVLSYHDVLFTGYKYEKDPGKPEEYEKEGITHYLMTKDGKWQALWKNGSVECCISGVESKGLLIMMIDSIYELYVPTE